MALTGELLEPDRVDQVPVGLEYVPVSAEEDQLGVRVGRPCGPEGATEPRDVRDQRFLRVPWGTVAPKLLDEIVDGHDPTARARRQARIVRSFDPAIGNGSPPASATSRGPRTRKRIGGG